MKMGMLLFRIVIVTICFLILLAASETARVADFIIIAYMFFLSISMMIAMNENKENGK